MKPQTCSNCRWPLTCFYCRIGRHERCHSVPKARRAAEPNLTGVLPVLCPCGFGELHSDGCRFNCDYPHKICLDKIAESVQDDPGIQLLLIRREREGRRSELARLRRSIDQALDEDCRRAIADHIDRALANLNPTRRTSNEANGD